jgi:uncharacterized protein
VPSDSHFWALVTFFAAQIPPAHAGDAIGLYLIAWGIFTTRAESLVKAGGWFGPPTAVVAWYASFAAVTYSTFGRVVSPVGPLGR